MHGQNHIKLLRKVLKGNLPEWLGEVQLMFCNL